MKTCVNCLNTTDNQFGFKSNSLTDICVFTFKEIVEYYNYHSSPVYVSYLDASKAFDRINHWKLFRKLSDRGMPIIVTRLLSVWYSTQCFAVKWNSVISDVFYVTNGVRQGGILSPILFNIYIDDLSCRLNNSGIGCHINGKCLNHIIYTDDSVILKPIAQWHYIWN